MQRLKVGCRIRPLLDGDFGKPVCVTPFCNAENGRATERLVLPAAHGGPAQKKKQQQEEQEDDFQQQELSSLLFCGNKKLSFDHVFFPDDRLPADDPSSPAGIFDTMVLPLVDAVSTDKNFNATLLLYGQTGAGKSHTLSSLVPLIVALLVERVGVENMMFRMVEIYGDGLRDLLNPNAEQAQVQQQQQHHQPLGGRKEKDPNQEQQPQLQLRETERGLQMTGATVAVIENEDDALWLFDEALRRRTTAATNMNSVSSRSHAIFTIFCTKPDGRVTKLNLVDLAGSERQKKTGNSGVRMKESVGINKDLLALGNVLRAVATRGASGGHIPYRQCKLTRILQDSLGGTALTSFLACVSPLFFNKDETLRTLQYCAVASAVLNQPVAVAPPPAPAPEVQQMQMQMNNNGEEIPVNLSELQQQHQQLVEQSQQTSTLVAGNATPSAPCKQCPVLSAALDKSEAYAFALENKLADLSENLESAHEDLKKDEKIFVLKYRDNRRLEKENAALLQRIAELEAQVTAMTELANHPFGDRSFQEKQQQQQQYSEGASFIVSPNRQFVPDAEDEEEAAMLLETENELEEVETVGAGASPQNHHHFDAALEEVEQQEQDEQEQEQQQQHFDDSAHILAGTRVYTAQECRIAVQCPPNPELLRMAEAEAEQQQQEQDPVVISSRFAAKKSESQPREASVSQPRSESSSSSQQRRGNALQERRNNRIAEQQQKQQPSGSGRSASGSNNANSGFTVQDCRDQYATVSGRFAAAAAKPAAAPTFAGCSSPVAAAANGKAVQKQQSRVPLHQHAPQQQQQHHDHTFVSDAGGASGGARELDFDTTSVLLDAAIQTSVPRPNFKKMEEI